MTFWNRGRTTKWPLRAIDTATAQIMNGKYIIEVALCSEGDSSPTEVSYVEIFTLWYTVHYWKGPQTLYTQPSQLIADKILGAHSIEQFVYDRDSFLQAKILVNRGLTSESKWFWIDPLQLEEIKQLESPDPP